MDGLNHLILFAFVVEILDLIVSPSEYYTISCLFHCDDVMGDVSRQAWYCTGVLDANRDSLRLAEKQKKILQLLLRTLC